MRMLTIVAFAILSLALAACGAVIDDEGFKIGSPRDFAEATHISQMSDAAMSATAQAVSIEATRQTGNIQAEATRTSIDADKRRAETGKAQSQATIAAAKAKSEVEAQPSEAAGKSALYLLGWAGAGVALLVLGVGLAFAFVALVNKRATSIYPDARGQFPVIVRKGAGFIAYHDPNRGLGPGTVLHTPGLLERAGYALALARGKAQLLQPGAEYPQPGSEAAMLQIASQEQAAQVRIAETANRPKFILAVDTSAGQARQDGPTSRMPSITVVNDPAQIDSFEQKLLRGEE